MPEYVWEQDGEWYAHIDGEIIAAPWRVSTKDGPLGFASESEAWLAVARRLWDMYATANNERIKMRATLNAIAEGCSFPEDVTQRAIRNVARAALDGDGRNAL